MPKQLQIETKLYAELHLRAKQKNLSVQEYIDQLIHENTDSIGITVWVPKNVMELLTAEGFFHNDSDEWFTNAVIHYCDAELSDLDVKIERELRRKYSFDC